MSSDSAMCSLRGLVRSLGSTRMLGSLMPRTLGFLIKAVIQVQYSIFGGLPLGSGSTMKLRSIRLGYLWLEAAGSGSGPQQAEVEPPDEKRVTPPVMID
jgi:hypothetical protein